MKYANGLSKDALWVVRYGETNDDYLLKTNLDKYIDLTGWSRKRFLLIAVAEYIKEQGDGPELVLQIAEYLMNNKRSR